MNRIRIQQQSAITQGAPTFAGTHAVGAILVAVLYWLSVSKPHSVSWFGIWLLSACVYSCWLMLERSRVEKVGEAAGKHLVRRTVLRAFLLGVIWGVLPWALFPSVTAAHMLTGGAIIAGMMAGGAFSLATIWAAALTFIWTMTTLVCLTIVSWYPFVSLYSVPLLVIYALFLSRQAFAVHRSAIETWTSQFELVDRNETISLLLNEYQTGGSDWLWQCDENGVLLNVSSRFADAAGVPMAEIEGHGLHQLFGPREDHPANDEFLTALERHHSFRDVSVVLPQADGQVRHWQMSGRPQQDGDGRFTGFRGIGSDVTQRVEAEAQVEHLAQFDPLTGLMNRTRLHRELTDAVDRLEEDETFALFLIDLDKFKSINDAAGYSSGDALLALVAERLEDSVGSRGVVAYMGADEFAVLHMSDKGNSEAILLSETMLGVFRKPFKVLGDEFHVAATSGVAIGRRGRTADEVLREASLALHGAKVEQRGSFRFFEPAMNAVARRRSLLESSLRNAVENQEFDLVYQPLVDAQTGRIRCMETLLRWRSPEHGIVSPAEFVPIAEESGLIVRLGEWVLGTATREAMTWPSHIQVAVNLSPVQFRSPRLQATVEAALSGSGLPANRLELEITESTFLEANSLTVELLRSVQNLGVHISLDDFGTGFSSLSYLKKFPFNKIKIDRSFIEDIAQDPASASIVKAIIDLAKALGMSTTAEGVEERAQLLLLRSLGCDTIQGYIFSPPRRAREVPQMIKSLTEPAIRVA